MESLPASLPLDGDFHHPYKPYDIQLQLMQCIYDVLSNKRKVAILESPTGTGKTLSLICSVITWLRENKADFIIDIGKNKETILEDDDNDDEDDDEDDEPDWVNESYKSSVIDAQLRNFSDYEALLDGLMSKMPAKSVIDSDMKNGIRRETFKKRKKNPQHIDITLNEEEFLPQPYHSDTEEAAASVDELERSRSILDKEVNDLLSKLDGNNQRKDSDSDSCHIELQNPVKIYFASRTHSQLNQFASQLELPKFPSSFEKQDIPRERLKYLPLASRKQLCINPAVNKWKSAEAINDACSELLKSKNGCSFYQPSSNYYKNHSSKSFRDHTFAQIHDIEDLTTLGESLHVCPYYACRDSLVSAEVITLPYQYLLSESTRESMSLDLTGSVVIIDEAHNLIDTINSIHSAEISLHELILCNKGLHLYLDKFKSRLNPGNRVNLMKLIKLLETLIEYLKRNFKNPGQEINPDDIFSDTNADILNIHKLNKYIKASKIAYKIDSYIQSLNAVKSIEGKGSAISNVETPRSTSQPLLFKVASFITCLSNPAEEGQFFFEKGPSLKYMLLEPGKSFQSILEKARCVILAGGTMEPVSDFLNNLFANIPRDRMTIFSCNHIIPDENLETYIIQESQFEFTFEKRQSASLVKGSLFQFYDKLSLKVPIDGGIVGFFPSYQYLEYVINLWKQVGLFERLSKVRKVFFESRGGPDPLPGYTQTVSQGMGAILFAVVGGKLSEGINFQDNLCRAVVMTGLPFPNVFSGEMVVKKKHLERKIIKNGGSKQDAAEATRDFYETICMKAVNQSIGRAIRHAHDYAIIYLLDKRYANQNIQKKLSHWVSKRHRSQSKVDEIMIGTQKFFSSHNKK